MLYRLFTPLFLVFVLFLYLAYLNPDTLTFKYAPGQEISAPYIAMLMLSFTAGALCLALIYFARGFGDLLAGIQSRFDLRKKQRQNYRLIRAEQTAAEGNLKKAIGMVDGVLRSSPKHFNALLLKGSLLRQNGETGDALKAHSLALALKPADKNAIAQLKDDYRDMRQWKAAYKLLEQLRERDPKDTVQLREMRELSELLGEFKRAILLQKEIINHEPNPARQGEHKRTLADLYCKHAEQLMKQKNWDEATRELTAAQKLQSGLIAASMMLSDIALKTAVTSDAENVLRKEFKTTGSLIPLRKLEEIHKATGKQEKVEILYRWAVSVRPEDMMLFLFLAMTRLENGDYEGAGEALDKAGKELNHLTVFNLARGIIQMQAEGNTNAGASAFKKALEGEWENFLSYHCSHCRDRKKEYFPKCRTCGRWNTASIVFS